MINLHVHSENSLHDSIIKPDQLIERLKEIGQNAVAITDHGNILGAVNFYKQLTAAGIKYIHGCEMYICNDATVKDKDDKYYHLLLLCKNETGRLNLNHLITMSQHKDHFYAKPRIDFNMLKKHGEGLIVASACLAGEVSKAIMDGELVKAESIARKYKEQFGFDYFLEIQSHVDQDQMTVNKAIVEIANRLVIPLIVTSDAHYTWEEDRKYQNKFAFNGKYKEDGEAYVDCFVQSEEDVRKKLWYLDQVAVDAAIRNTHLIADQCTVEMPLSAPIMPKIDTPPEYQSNKAWLQDLCIDGFRKKLNIDFTTGAEADPERKILLPIYGEEGQVERYEPQSIKDKIPEYIERYEYELDSLDRMGFLDYILLVYSYASIGDRRGPGRGSGGGSLICYLTDITDIDPVEHKLYFERFIDVGAIAKLEAGEITAKDLKIPD